MTAWQILLSKSALVIGTAWQHLNSIVGLVTIFGPLEVDISGRQMEVEIENKTIDVELSGEIEVELPPGIEIET